MSNWQDLPDETQQPQPATSRSGNAWVDLPPANVRPAAIGALTANPDRTVQDALLAQRYKTTPSLVGAARTTFEERAAADDAAKIMLEAPKLSGWYTMAPENAALVKDDLQNAADLERLLESMRPDYLRGVKLPEVVFPKVQSQTDGSIWERTTRAWQEGQAGNRIAVHGFLQMPLDGLAEMFPSQFGNLAEANREKIQGYREWVKQTPYSTAEGGKKAWEDFVRSSPLMATQISLGLLGGGVTIPTAFMGTQISGSQYADLTESDVNGGRAFFAALGNTAMQLPLEAIQLNRFMNIFKGSGLGQIARRVGESALTSFVTESLQNYPDALTTLWAKSTRTGQNPMSQFLNNLGQYTFDGMYEGLLSIPWALLGGSGRIAYDIGRYRTLNKDVEFFHALDGSAAASKLKERLPQAYHNLVDHMTAGGPVQSLYISPAAMRSAIADENVLYQTANDMGVSQEAFNRAEELGADLEVPLNLYQGKIAGTEVSLALRGEVRTSPEGMTLTEQTAFSQSFRQQVETAVAEYRDNLLQDDELNTALAPIETELAAVYGKEGARANVALLRARANMAAQAWREAGKNITPAQWVQEVAKLRVAVEGQVQSMAGSGLSASVDKDFAKVTPKAHDVLAKPVKDVLVHNGVETLDDLYALAGQAKEGFQSGIASIAKATGGQPMFRPGDGLKGRARAHEKIDRDYPEMGAKRVLDMLGGTILYDSRADVEKALPEIERLVQEAGWEIIPARTKNRFDKPSSGYKDYFLNIRQPNGLVTELLLTTKAMNQAKTEGAGHYLYEAMQKAEAVLKDKNATKEEKKEAKRIRASLDEASEGYYGSTGDQSNETASISEIVEPLNKISAPGASSAISNLYGELEPLLGNIRKMLPSSANTNGISSHSINFLTNTGELGPSDSQGIPTASRPSMNRAINGLSDISEPPSNANNIVQDGTQNKGDRRIAGAETAIILGAHGEQKARYEVRELADIIPSHDPENQFTKRTDYPNNVQERPYHSDAGEQEKVRGNALRLDLRLVVNNNPDLTNGPPAITENGIVLGGNSRAMSIQLAYANNSERAMAYKDAIVSQAAGFGLDGTAVATMERPVLVRVVEGGDTADMGKLARLYNQTMMQGLQSKAEGVSKARLFSADTLATLSADMATFDSLREFLGHTASKPFISALLRDGILEQTQLARLTENNGRLNDTGKKLVEDALRGLIVPDYDILSSIPASALNKLDRVIPALARMKAQGEGWDMSGMVTAALRQIANATTEGKKVDVFLAQGDLIETDPDKKRPAVQALALTFANATQKEVQARFELMARDSEKRTKGQNVLVAMPENTPAQSFQTAFMGTIAAVDGQSFARFAPQADPLHAALDYAHKNGGKGHSVAAALEKLQKSLVNKKATAEQKEAAKEMSQQLSRFSGTVAVYSPKLGTFFQYQPGKELFQADTALARDAKAWGKAVDAIAASGKAPSSPVLMLGQTPLVMQMLGAEERPIYAAPHMFDGTHKNITPDMIKSLPKALADPIAVFQSQTHHDRLVFMLELMDAQGATVVVPVQLDGTKYRSTIHIATTAYAKEKNGRPDNAWFAKQAENALYINRAKEKRWLMVSGSYSLWDAASTLSKKIVRTDADLVNLRQENLELYQGQNIGARGSIAFNDNETLIRLFKDSADFSTFIHEIGHLFVKDMENMVATGQAPEQVVRDLEIMKAFTAEFSDPDTLRGFYKKSFRPQRAPFKERDFSSLTDAERIEVRNVAKQEKLAQAFETYMSEGKAPSVALRPVFQRFRIWLQRIYQALTGQVSINPEIRGVFDRMLASDQDTLLAEQVHHAQSAEIAALDAVAAKMLTEQEQGRLAKARENAAAVSREQRLKKVLQAYYRAAVNRKEIRAQAADTVNSMPVYAAQDQAIAEGGIHLDAVREEYGADVANAILKKRPGLLRKEGTVSLHDLAIVHGFAGEEALLDAICQSSGKKAEISSLVKAEIAAREEAIRKEIGLDNGINSGDLDYYSDQRLEALEMEARALSRASGEHGPKGRTFGAADA